jgi:hypothetical protein
MKRTWFWLMMISLISMLTEIFERFPRVNEQLAVQAVYILKVGWEVIL